MSDQNLNTFDDEPISLDPEPDDDEPISLVDEGQVAASRQQPSVPHAPKAGGAPGAHIKPVGAAAGGIMAGAPSKRSYGRGLAEAVKKIEFKRPMNLDGTGATRCRIFHSKIAEAPLSVMQHHINEWLDSEEIEVKQVGHVVGTMQGKSTEPNLIVVVWY